MKASAFFRSHLLQIAVIGVAIISTFGRLPETFFQQDEWQSLAASIYYSGRGAGGIVESFFPIDPLSHFNPGARAYSWIEFFLFHTSFDWYAWVSVLLHFMNALLIYFFIWSWLKNRSAAFTASLIFSVNSISHQAVTWVAAINSYEIPTIFILLSLIFFQRKKFLTSFLMLFISLLFHENGIFLFLFYPLVLSLDKKSQWRKFLPICLGTALLFILIRVPFFFGFIRTLPETTDISHPSIVVYPYRAISILLKSFAGSIIPESYLIRISSEVTRLAYPQFILSDGVPNPYIVQSIVFDFVSYVLTMLLLGVALLIIRSIRNKSDTSVLIWSLLFVSTSLLPYIFVLGKAGYASILEPKFFYVGSIGVAIFLAVLTANLLHKFSMSKPALIGIYGLLTLYVFAHSNAIKVYLNNLSVISNQRKSILNEIKNSYPTVPEKVIFYTESDTAYYGMPQEEKILPFQIGFGKILMVWFQENEHFPSCLYADSFLEKILEEGYRMCEGRGFGYYRNFYDVSKALKTYNLPPEAVVAYSWTHKTKEFVNITERIQRRLKYP